MRRRWWGGLAFLLAAGLGGCSDGTKIQISGDQGGTDRAIPLIGYYSGGFLNYGHRNTLEFQLQRDGSATGLLRLLDLGQRIDLVGQVGNDRVLRMSSAEVSIEGVFSGAWNPNRPGEYVRDGVLFYGTWRQSSGGSGRSEAAHVTWPPPPDYTSSPSQDTTWTDIWTDDDGGSSGSSGSSGSGGSSGTWDSGGSGGSGFDPGSTSPGSPPSTGGEPTTDDIIYRRPVELPGS